MKRSLLIILFTVLPFLMTGCQKEAAPPLPQEETSSEAAGEESAAQAPKEEEAPQEEETPKAPAEEEPPAWASLSFVLDEESLTLPFAYSQISDSWKIDPEFEEVSEDTVLAPGERTNDGIPLISEKWGSMLVSAGFVNESEEEKPLSQCSIWILALDATWAEEEERPALSLPGEISWGADEGALKEAYGEPSVEPFYSESMYYSSYSYSWQYLREMELVVYDEQGLTAFTLKTSE